MYQLVFTNRFRKDIKRLQSRRYDMEIIKKVITNLEITGELQPAFQPHKLSGNYTGYWEGHIKSDWLIIWKLLADKNEIWLTRTGTHSDLF
jgi:mRNA interferase YafQ